MEFRLIPFEPGDPRRFVLPETWGGTVRRTPSGLPGCVCEVELPSRLHASVVDMTRFEVGKPGGGGIGFAINLTCRARVTLMEGRGVETRGSRSAVGRHFAALFQSLAGHEGRIEIEAEDHGRRHMGLGSSITTLTAVATALNEALGRPLGLRDLRKLVAHNYCEEALHAPGQLVEGFETNVGAMAGLHGGMVVATDGCELLYRVPLPERMRALLVLPNLGPPVSSGEEEARALLGKARAMDRRDRKTKAYKILMELMPAMVAGDFRTVGDVIFELQTLGSKKAECRLHGRGGREIQKAMAQLREKGAEIVCMSSVGPAVCALSDNPEVWASWKEWLSEQPSCRALEVPTDNGGARVRLDGVPIPYRIEPWWNKPV